MLKLAVGKKQLRLEFINPVLRGVPKFIQNNSANSFAFKLKNQFGITSLLDYGFDYKNYFVSQNKNFLNDYLKNNLETFYLIKKSLEKITNIVYKEF